MNRYGFHAAMATSTPTVPYPAIEPYQPWNSAVNPFFATHQPTAYAFATASSETQVLPSAPTDTLYASDYSATISASTSTFSTVPTYTAVDAAFGPATLWAHISHSAQVAIILSITLVVFSIIIFSFWFCCGGRARWARQGQQLRCGRTGSNSSSVQNLNPRGGGRSRTSIVLENRLDDETRGPSMAQITPSSSIISQNASMPSTKTTDLPPPRYEEVVPHQHQHLAGGMLTAQRGSGSRDEEEMGVISDGKMPVSEMVFEDVVPGRGRDRGRHGGVGVEGEVEGRRSRSSWGLVEDRTGHTNT